MREGRQDIVSPEPTLEESDPIRVQEERGNRMIAWIAVVAIVFLAVIIYVIVS